MVGHSPEYLSDLSTPAADVPGTVYSERRRRAATFSMCNAYTPQVRGHSPPLLLSGPGTDYMEVGTYRQLRSIPAFKRKLKTFLFSSPGNCHRTDECALGVLYHCMAAHNYRNAVCSLLSTHCIDAELQCQPVYAYMLLCRCV